MADKNAVVLGIETSCDETAAAVVRGGRHILTNIISSQIPVHRPYGGVVPELASRAHVENIQGVVQAALKTLTKPGQASFPKVFPADLIAVSVGPGLNGSLLTGKMVAEMLAWTYRKPLVGVNHLEAHLYSLLPANPHLQPPYLGLVVSGGHTDLVCVEKFGKYKVLGRTRDDAAGEAFDKVAKLLSLSYPGGPEIEKCALKGNGSTIAFPRAYLPDSWDFSFSGLKTAVVYYLRDNPSVKESKKKMAHLCASFQAAVADMLVKKTLLAADQFNFHTVVVCGGVAANGYLRKAFGEKAGKVKIIFAPPALCTDNAVMVAVAGYYKFIESRRGFETKPLTVNPNLALKNW